MPSFLTRSPAPSIAPPRAARSKPSSQSLSRAERPPSPPILNSYFHQYPTRSDSLPTAKSPREQSRASSKRDRTYHSSEPVAFPSLAVLDERPPAPPAPLPPPVELRHDRAVIAPTRRRPRTKSSPHEPASAPLRFSVSSSLTHATSTTVDTDMFTPPRTPPNHQADAFLSNVSVISGVETMDALVDEMNADFSRRGSDDVFSFVQRRDKPDKKPPATAWHNPLYHPPLPEPPAGIKLGGRVAPDSAASKTSEPSLRARRGPLSSKRQAKAGGAHSDYESELDATFPAATPRPVASPVSRIPILASLPRRESSRPAAADASLPAPSKPRDGPALARSQRSRSPGTSSNNGAAASTSKSLRSPSVPASHNQGHRSNRIAVAAVTPAAAFAAAHAAKHKSHSTPSPRANVPSEPPTPTLPYLSPPPLPTSGEWNPGSAVGSSVSTKRRLAPRSPDPDPPLLVPSSSSGSSPSMSHYATPSSSPRTSSRPFPNGRPADSGRAAYPNGVDCSRTTDDVPRLVPSITDIIRTHAPEVAASRERERELERAKAQPAHRRPSLNKSVIGSRSSWGSGYGVVLEGNTRRWREEEEGDEDDLNGTLAQRRSSLRGRRSVGRDPAMLSLRDRDFHRAAPLLEDDIISTRSSMDSVALEVEQTLTFTSPLRRVGNEHTPPVSARSGPPIGAGSLHTRVFMTSPTSEAPEFLCAAPDARPRRPSTSSVGSRKQKASDMPIPSFEGSLSPRLLNPTKEKNKDIAIALANYLRSPKLTRLLTLRRPPHSTAVTGAPALQVSLSVVGKEDGHPVIVFLGLGCVRYLTGLYDEMAAALNLKLICVDRWGLGRTSEPIGTSTRGVLEWAAVMEEVLDILGLKRVSVLAHSAGAPYAMAFSQRLGSRIIGDVCLMAPWVGGAEGAGYKWLKYVPNSLLKTAQTAEWKVQGWKLGKPPALTYDAIGYNPHLPTSSNDSEMRPRKTSFGAASHFSEYDDLADFQGRFGSGSTLCIADQKPATSKQRPPTSRKPSKGFLSNIWKSGGSPSPASPSDSSSTAPSYAPRLKGLKSMGSLKGSYKSSQRTRTTSSSTAMTARTTSTSPVLPQVSAIGVGLGLDWGELRAVGGPSPTPSARVHDSDAFAEAAFLRGRRSVSENSSYSPPRSARATPDASETSLAAALLAASHAESSRGMTADLLCILNHDGKPWGFSYTSFPHPVKVWYGDRDEKIGEAGVRWMETIMKVCEVRVVKGAGHSLMVNAKVVVEALECIAASWGPLN